MTPVKLILGLALCCAASAHAQQDGRAIAQKMQAVGEGFGDQEVDIKMELRNAQGEAAVRAFRIKALERGADGTATLIVFDSPSDVKGTALLSHSDKQWLYLPASKRVRRIASGNRTGPFLGSEFSFEDLAGETLDDSTWTFLREAPCGDRKCFEIQAQPKGKSGYTKRVFKVDQATHRVESVDYYDRKDALLKTLTHADYKAQAGKHQRAGVSTMKNHQTGKSTVLRYGTWKFGNGFSASDFSKAKLKQVR